MPIGSDDVEPASDVGSEEIRRHDSDDGERDPLEREPAADRIRGTPKSTLPERIADDNDWAVWAAAAPIVRAVNVRPTSGVTPSVSKHPGGRPDALDEFATPPLARLKRCASHAKALSKRCGRRCSSARSRR